MDNGGLYRRWISDISGYDLAETEVIKRVLRVKAQGVPPRSPMPSTWRYGTGPMLRAAAPGDGYMDTRPAPMAAVAEMWEAEQRSGGQRSEVGV